MSFYLPPLAKKKNVSGVATDSSRVFDGVRGESTPLATTHQQNFSSSSSTSENRDVGAAIGNGESRNRPHGKRLVFNRDNPRLINAPVCCVRTERTKESSWWPEPTGEEEKRREPSYSLDSTSRWDYRLHATEPLTSTRRNRNRQTARGIVPALARMSSDPVLYESISYQHQYDSRRNQPVRGRLHGSFVWKSLPPLVQNASEKDEREKNKR
ncbi:uncharacterized protein C2orf73 homolog [Oscarella lobularis]|uniref:uncharacterized protein C2orf73 homolog n=1 Tax=Oscarella lobularis TaxID=121494 RepID=UPI003313878F